MLETEKIRCSRCGKEIERQSKFCRFCGNPIPPLAAPENPEAAVPPAAPVNMPYLDPAVPQEGDRFGTGSFQPGPSVPSAGEAPGKIGPFSPAGQPQSFPAAGQAPFPPAPSAPQFFAGPPPQKKDGKKAALLAAAIVLTVLVAGVSIVVAVMAFSLWGPAKEKGPESSLPAVSQQRQESPSPSPAPEASSEASEAFLTGVIPRDIDQIYGAPEFFGLRFKDTAEQAREKVEIDAYIIPAGKIIKRDSILRFNPDAFPFELYGLEAGFASIGFDGPSLSTVQLVFFAKDAGYEEVVGLYTQIYGTPDVDNKELFGTNWVGEKTRIGIQPLDVDRDGTKDTVVTYSDNDASLNRENGVFEARFNAGLTLGEDELDPCGFWGEGSPLGEPIWALIGTGKPEADYTLFQSSWGDDYYRIYPYFSYLGGEDSYLEFEVNEGSDGFNVSSASYFTLYRFDESKGVAGKAQAVNRKLEERFGEPMYGSKLVIEGQEDQILEGISADELSLEGIEQERRDYRLYRGNGKGIIALYITSYPDDSEVWIEVMYYEG